MRIMSFNILCGGKVENDTYWTSRVNAVMNTIKAAAPDSFGVQEATPQWMAALTAALPMYGHVGVGRDDGKNDGEYSAVFYLRSKYTLEDSDTFWLSETPDEPSCYPGASCHRICTYAVLVNRETGAKYIHANTHLDHVSNDARVHGAELIMERMGKYDMPCVLTGDFNAREDSSVYKTFTESDMFADSKYVAKDTTSGITFHAFKGPSEGSPIDFIFITDKYYDVLKYKIMNEKVGDRYASDHFAIYSDIVLK